MVFTQASLCPLLSTVFGLLAFFIGYAIAVSKDHVDPFLPFISDCGNLQPESGIFGILLNFSSFFLILTIYFVYRNFVVFEEKVEEHKLGKWKWLSLILMFLGMTSSVGATMVANFQEGAQLTTHDTGAFLFFIGICIYFWGQVFISLLYKPKNVAMWMTIFRLLLCIAITLFLIFHLTCLFFNPFIEKNASGVKPTKPPTEHGIERYHKGDPWYWNHIATTLSEWILALLIEAFVLTFTYDLAFTCLESPTVRPFNSFKSDIPTAETIFYSSQIAPMEPILPKTDSVPTMRRLPRIDTYGTTQSRLGKEEIGSSLISSAPYERTKMVASYDQYQYF